MYHEQHGGGKPLKKLPSDFKLMMTKDGKIFFGNKKFYTTDIINTKMLFGYTFYETKNSIYYHEGVARAVTKSINSTRV